MADGSPSVTLSLKNLNLADCVALSLFINIKGAPNGPLVSLMALGLFKGTPV